MCGIAGVLDADGRVDTVSLAAMGHLLEHRGPDDHGLVVDVLGAATAIAVEDGAAPIGGAHLGLAHRRLSIIDPDAGPQPMANDDGSRYITYNGELYNTAELRTWLRARGHRFRTATDTEVVLRAHEELGVRAVDALEGMFAYAVWDRRRGELVVVRDRVGVKPVYLWSSPSRLAFASEVKAFLALDGWRAAADPLHVVEYLTFQNTFGTRTLFSEVRLLEPGHFVVARIRGDRVVTSEHRYWEITADALPAPDRGRPDARDEGEEVRRTFEAVVGSQLVADVPVGTYLSGGMDTGAISAVARRRIAPLHTFTCGFDLSAGVDETEERSFDEREQATRLAAVLDTVHHEMVVRPGDVIDVFPAIAWHLDEPRVGISYQNYLVAGLVSEHVKVVLSGVGGDELFGGYPWRYRRAAQWSDPDAFLGGYANEWQRLSRDDDRRRLFVGDFARAADQFSPRDACAEVLAGCEITDPVQRAMWFDAKTFLRGLLVVEDKLSMAHSVESRVPFCDTRMVDLAMRIPASAKLTADDTKVVLKHALAPLLPAETLRQPKVGFTPPDATWYRASMQQYVRDLVLGEQCLARGWYRADALSVIVDEHMEGRRNHRMLLWSLMSLEWWARLFIDRRGDPRDPRGIDPLLEEAPQ